MNFKYVVLQTEKEALNYLESIKDNLADDIYKKAKDRIKFNYLDDDRKMTIKSLNDFIVVLELAKQGKYEEADEKAMEFAVENMNIWLKEEGIAK
ncbi:hypothetical protein HMPREF9309_01452 [Campylobacter ureolyticus ACS-301-V-Sch3b]|uniref:Uncharacterized protein n=1 Tax=Campylobacter ureolyticus ACS-301-V-Sch3b TaxID=883165 RepID=S3XBR7_9BACT|nr:hypothetical protein [Campylobacter ureolyticus]EPH07551.1 hypothetical protein HMPREF9309_01452 [Campylobacter ureolyticus ACS-301-V-Sch3b]